MPNHDGRQPHMVSVHFSLGATDKALLNEIVELTNADSRSEVARRALQVYHLVMKVQAEGGRTTFNYPDGTSERLFVLL